MCVEACTCVSPARTRPIRYYCLYLCANCVALFQLILLNALRYSKPLLYFSLRSQQSVRSRYSCERPSTERNDTKRNEQKNIKIVKHIERNDCD